MARSSIARQTRNWIETLISFALAIGILSLCLAGAYYLVVVV